MTPEDEAKIREIVDQAVNQGPKPHRIVHVSGLLKTPGRVQYEMRHLSFFVEEDLPADRKRSDVVREICQDLGPLVLEFEPATPSSPSPSRNSTGQTPAVESQPYNIQSIPWMPSQYAPAKEYVSTHAQEAEDLFKLLDNANATIQKPLEIQGQLYWLNASRTYISRRPKP